MSSIAVCVITIGKEYQAFYEKYFKPSQERYCKKYGYPLINITDYLDPNPERHIPDYISFQKILVGNHPAVQEYDYVLVLDADIYILSNAPPLSDLTTLCGDKVGVVNEACDPTYPLRELIMQNKMWPKTPTEYYNSILPNIPFETNKVINTGFLFMQPSKQKSLFDNIFETYAEGQKGNKKEFHYEQASIGYELQIQDKAFYLDNRWNCIFLIHAENPFQNLMDPEFFYDFFIQRYSFLHFCAKQFLSFAEFLEASNL